MCKLMSKGANSRKKAEAQQLQIEVGDDEAWHSILERTGLLVVDVYSDWCGPCSSMTGHFRRIKMELGDDCLTLALASADKISFLEKFRGKAEPTFLFFGSGKPLCVIHGADGPLLLNTIRERLAHERNVAKGKAEKTNTSVLLDSLVKPEEVIEPDEDLDDIEGDKAEDSEDENTKPMEAVLLISPTVIATDRTEPFLSQLVSASFTICGHVQKEVTSDELHLLLYPPPAVTEEEEQVKEPETSRVGSKEEEEKKGEAEELAKENALTAAEVEQLEKDLEFWEEELSKGPLYMLLLRTEEGDIFELWSALLGPTELSKAKSEAPDSLIGQFGDEDLAMPAWLPRSSALQQLLKGRFFPPPLDADVPRLLLLPDPDDHQQVLEALCSGGLQVLAHTQVTFNDEAFTKLNTSAYEQILRDCIGSQLLAVVITGGNAASVSTELRSLHLTTRAETALDEVAIFFPELAADLMSEPSPLEEPQTQMQIEQKKENLEK